MDKIVKLVVVLIILGGMAQGAMYGSAWMDDKAFSTAILQTLGDNMTAKQMEKDIVTQAQQQKVPVTAENVKVTIDCGEGPGRAPSTVTSRLGVIGVTKSCTVTGTADYTRKVGVMSKKVHLVQTKNFAAAAAVYVPGGGSSGVQMPNVMKNVPSESRMQNID